MNGSNPYDEAGRARPGYGAAWETPRYQSIGPSEDSALDRVIMSVGTGSDAGYAGGSVSPFEIVTPNAKARTRIAIAIEPGNNTVNLDTDPVTGVLGAQRLLLWLALRTAMRAEFAVPCTAPTRNLAGTGAAPLVLPTDVRLWGWEMEIETAGQNIRGAIGLASDDVANAPYVVHLVVRYNSIERLSNEEWKQLAGRAGIRRGDRVGFAGGE